MPENESNREYLGLCGKQETTTLGRIGAEVLIVEIFSMYCPHCQKHAPKANELFHAIEGSDKYRGRIKLIGIGVGNSAFEVDIFRQKYAPPFPSSTTGLLRPWVRWAGSGPRITLCCVFAMGPCGSSSTPSPEASPTPAHFSRRSPAHRACSAGAKQE